MSTMLPSASVTATLTAVALRPLTPNYARFAADMLAATAALEALNAIGGATLVLHAGAPTDGIATVAPGKRAA